MGKTAAAIAGLSEWKAARVWDQPIFNMEAMAQQASELVADTGIEKGEIDGIVIAGAQESPMLAPSAVAEYLGIRSRFNERVDIGGATPAGMVWRAAAAIEVGVCESVLVLCPSVPQPPEQADVSAGKMVMPPYLFGETWGSPQGQFEIPAGLVAATPSYAMIARRYMSLYDLDEETLAKIAVQERYNAQSNPDAIFYGKTITLDDVVNSRVVADPLKLLEVVMPCFGGAAVLVTSLERAKRANHRPAIISGFGEELTHKSLTYMPDILDSPVRGAAERAFRMAGSQPDAMDMVAVYDCYTITVLVSLEDAGFCKKGQGAAFIREHDLRHDGKDFPLNTHGGQLGAGQAGLAAGLSHVTEAVRQIQGRAGDRQLPTCERAYVNGNGGMMSEQVSLVLEGA
jgi:acetyl-CoA acetyltransferase